MAIVWPSLEKLLLPWVWFACLPNQKGKKRCFEDGFPQFQMYKDIKCGIGKVSKSQIQTQVGGKIIRIAWANFPWVNSIICVKLEVQHLTGRMILQPVDSLLEGHLKVQQPTNYHKENSFQNHALKYKACNVLSLCILFCSLLADTFVSNSQGRVKHSKGK